MNQLLLDAVPVAGLAGVAAAVMFFLVFIAVAIAAFLILRKSVKMAIRMVIVGLILVIAIVGGIAFLWLGVWGSSGGHRPGPPPPTRTNR